MKLHLGCGARYLEGYVNVDLPEEATVQKRQRQPDVIGDFTEMTWADESCDEIRLEHVFEHFQRHVAVGFLCRWWRMLKYGGVLIIAVPDVEACMLEFTNPLTSIFRRRALIRHMYGSHENQWATHHEGWYHDSLRDVFLACGFVHTRTIRNGGGDWAEIMVVGKKVSTFAPDSDLIETFLSYYDVNDGMLEGWMKHIQEELP